MDIEIEKEKKPKANDCKKKHIRILRRLSPLTFIPPTIWHLRQKTCMMSIKYLLNIPSCNVGGSCGISLIIPYLAVP